MRAPFVRTALFFCVAALLLAFSSSVFAAYTNDCNDGNTVNSPIIMSTSMPMAGSVTATVTRYVHFNTTDFQTLVCTATATTGNATYCGNGGTFKAGGTTNYSFSLRVFAMAMNNGTVIGNAGCAFKCGSGADANAVVGTFCTVTVGNSDGLPVELKKFSVSSAE